MNSAFKKGGISRIIDSYTDLFFISLPRGLGDECNNISYKSQLYLYNYFTMILLISTATNDMLYWERMVYKQGNINSERMSGYENTFFTTRHLGVRNQ